MKRHIGRKAAFTVVELLVILIAVVALLLLLISRVPRAKEKVRQQQCGENLKVIGVAFHLWSTDSSDWFPTQVPDRRGGAQQAITRGEVWRAFQVMSNELAEPRFLICPSDNRLAVPAFAGLQFNSNVSYFIGMDTSADQPQMFLSGDPNLEVDGVATKSGIVMLQTNDTVGWTAAIHKRSGNIALADGSVLPFDKQRMNEALARTGVTTNRLALP